MIPKSSIDDIFKILLLEFDNNIDTQLWYKNNYQLLVAIMLSAQATDKGVNKITDKLFLVLKKPKDAIQLGEQKINEYIKTINYHNTKSKHIVKMSKQLIDNFNGEVPNNFDDLISLAGVGRKTANLVLSIAFKQANIAVDTHVFRVSNRIGLTNAKNVLETEKQLSKIVPFKFHRQINNLLIPFGRKYCRAIGPKCQDCPIKKFCSNYKKRKNKTANL